jgi:hypothetical protein
MAHRALISHMNTCNIAILEMDSCLRYTDGSKHLLYMGYTFNYRGSVSHCSSLVLQRAGQLKNALLLKYIWPLFNS